ncbi:hypothetical protein AB2L28_00890 [Kineococcus sp. TBRC 1896]|uniref:AraC family transcriptional regulator n=1 Tax=Kineococcus mangrovi TaxID=1660183 RepID=A0ABV4HWJ3_9ACTN
MTTDLLTTWPWPATLTVTALHASATWPTDTTYGTPDHHHWPTDHPLLLVLDVEHRGTTIDVHLGPGLDDGQPGGPVRLGGHRLPTIEAALPADPTCAPERELLHRLHGFIVGVTTTPVRGRLAQLTATLHAGAADRLAHELQQWGR